MELANKSAEAKADYCKACELFKSKKGLEPDCEKCLPPLLPENTTIALVYFLVRPEFSKDLVIKMIDLYEIPDRRETFERVLKLHGHIQMMDS